MHAPFDAMSISLRELFPHAHIFHSPNDIFVETLCSDSRRVRTGDLFVAMMGRERDGHDHVVEALENGAGAVLTERLLPISAPQCVVEDTRVAHARLCLELAGRPDRQLRVTGVAGTAGKTVTSLLMASILKESGRRVGLTSTIGYCDSEDLAPAVETTPRSPQLATWLGRMAENGCRDAVIELDHRALGDRRASAVPLHTAVLTNLRRPSRELMQGDAYEVYCRRNRQVFQQLADDGVVILNADDEQSMAMASSIGHGLLTVGVRNDADLTAKVLERNRGEQLFLLRAGTDSAPVRTRMLGDFHVHNCLLAAAAGLRLGLTLEQIVRGLEALDRVPGRLDRVVAGQGCGVFLDSSQETATLADNLRELRKVTPGRVICVFSGHPAEDETVCAARGRVVERGADYGLVTGHQLGAKASLQTMHDVLDGWQAPERAHLMPSREQAIRWALQQARDDDTVFVAGAAANEREWLEVELRGQVSCQAPSATVSPVIFRIEDYR